MQKTGGADPEERSGTSTAPAPARPEASTAASRLIVDCSSRIDSGACTPRSLSMAANKLAAPSESPPSAKKSSSTPSGATRSTSSHSDLR